MAQRKKSTARKPAAKKSTAAKKTAASRAVNQSAAALADSAGFHVAIAGATGAVGTEMIEVLEASAIPVAHLYPLASERSVGKDIEFRGTTYKVAMLSAFDFKQCDFALFSPGGSVSKVQAPRAAKAGCVVIDNTSAFRLDPKVPLVVPEVNADAIAGYAAKNIIANPNCSTIQMVVALKPLHDYATLTRVIVSTYQAASGAGQKAMDELAEQTVALFNNQEVPVAAHPYRLAFNCIPQIQSFLANGYTEEEMKLVNETRKILGAKKLPVTATAVRIPVFCGHSEAITIETKKKLTPAKARQLLTKAPGVIVVDDPKHARYPMPMDAAGQDAVLVGRIRPDLSSTNGLMLWVVSDNLRKGAALNAVQIAEHLTAHFLEPRMAA